MRIVNQHKIIIWYVITIIFTGIMLVPHLIWQGAGSYSISFTQLGPMFSTILILGIIKDKDRIQTIKCGLRPNIQNIKWYGNAVYLPIIMTGTSGILLLVIFQSPYVAWNGSGIFFILNFLGMLFGCIGEEIGWRGYLLPIFQQKYNPLLSSIFVGILWGIWHLNYISDVAFWLLFIITTIELSIIFTYLLYQSGGDLYTSILLHTVLNFSNRLFLWERFSLKLLFIEIIVFGIICAIIIVKEKQYMLCTEHPQ